MLEGYVNLLEEWVQLLEGYLRSHKYLENHHAHSLSCPDHQFLRQEVKSNQLK